jgi:hypothetical protein
MRIFKLFFLILLVFLFSFSCEKIKTEDKKLQQKTVVVLFDLSGSTKELRNIYLNSFKKILSSITHGDVIVAAKITDSSITEPEIPVKEEFPEFIPRDKMGNPTDNEFLIRKAKKEADVKLANKKDEIVKTIKNFLFRVSTKKTDIMSSLHIAERIFKTYNGDKSILVIMSDMVEESDVYNFKKEKLIQRRIQEIINNEKTKNRLPDLHNVKVYVVAAGAPSAEEYFFIQNFWLKYFKECGANLAKENYGSALIQFDE